MKHVIMMLILAIGFFCSLSASAVEPGMIHMCVKTNGNVFIDNTTDTCGGGETSMYVQKAIPGQRVAMGVLAHVEADDEVYSPFEGGPIPGMTKTFTTTSIGCVTALVRIQPIALIQDVSVTIDNIPMLGQGHKTIPDLTIVPGTTFYNSASANNLNSPTDHTFWMCNINPGSHVVEVDWIADNAPDGIKERSMIIQGW